MDDDNSRFVFSVTSYNILCQQYITDNMYLYRKCKFDNLECHYRESVMLKEFFHLDSDVICLQEVDAQRYDEFWQHAMREHYKGTYLQKTQGKPDGCAIFFRERVFQLIAEKDVFFESVVLEGDFARPNIAQIICLQAKNGQRVIVANTHLIFNTRKQMLRLAHAHHLAKECSALMSQYDAHAMVVCGDMNDNGDSMLGAFFIGELSDDRFSSSMQWKSVYRDVGQNKYSTTFTDCDSPDHIFYHGASLKLHNVLSLFSSEQVGEHKLSKRVPNHQCPSDHIPLHATFSI